MLINEILLESGEAPIYYFAYGMLCDPTIMKSADLIGMATLPNFEYELLQFANVVPTPGSKVYGTLWNITRKFLSELDMVEGYPQFYDRKTVPVMVNGKRYEAAVYTMTPESRDTLQGSHPSQRYINKIVRGYKHAGVPLDQLRNALKDAHRRVPYRE
jgi:gamma-glutamylcyclotransferase (GGCT)/AIG2-like uncharacterized protein YtfP